MKTSGEEKEEIVLKEKKEREGKGRHLITGQSK